MGLVLYVVRDVLGEKFDAVVKDILIFLPADVGTPDRDDLLAADHHVAAGSGVRSWLRKPGRLRAGGALALRVKLASGLGSGCVPAVMTDRFVAC